MGQLLHSCARTTETTRRCLQTSQASLAQLAQRYNLNPKTKRSTVRSLEEAAAIIAFRKHTLLSLDDCLYALQATIPHLSRSALHRCLQRHGMSRLPEVEGDKPT